MKFKAVMLSLGLSLFFATPYYANDGKVNIVNCAFLNDENNKFTFFDDSSVKNETFTEVNINDVTNSKIYENKDWDFNNVWSMPNSESTYRFPIVTIYFQSVQNAL